MCFYVTPLHLPPHHSEMPSTNIWPSVKDASPVVCARAGLLSPAGSGCILVVLVLVIPFDQFRFFPPLGQAQATQS